MKQFVTEESFWELFPEAQIGIVVAHNMKPTEEVAPEDAAAIARALAEANGKADQHLESNTISQNEVVAVWRDAYQKFKTKKGARCSIENLLKRVLKGNPVGSITPSVDIYNTVSLTHALPVGGEDIDAMAGDIRLGITEGGDAFRPLGEEEDAPTLEGELCYRDDAGAICRCWNWRDGERTALTDDSKKAFLIIESVDPARADDLAAAHRPAGRHGAAVPGCRHLRQADRHPRQSDHGDRRIISWLVLIASGVMESVWAIALGKSEGLSHVGPTIVFVVALVLSMLGLSFAVKTLPTGTAYAVWVGIGAALTVIYGMVTGQRAPARPGRAASYSLRALSAAVIGLKLVDEPRGSH